MLFRSGRFRTPNGRYNFAKYRQKWLEWNRQHAHMYQVRLRDIETLTQKSQPNNLAELREIQELTLRRSAELEALLAVNNGTKRTAIPYFQTKSPIVSWLAYLQMKWKATLTPILRFLNLELYFKYQNLRRFLSTHFAGSSQ